MPAPARVLRAAALVCGVLVPARSAAQGSPYVPLDDPRLPLLEHLIARGDVADPSPQVRPYRWADAARVLAAADTTGAPASGLIRSLRAAFEVPAGDRWRLAARGGAQAFSHIRRDVLHPLGPDGVRPYADFTGEATMGPIVLVSRPAAEPRLPDDPEWPGRTDLELAWRMVEAYGSVFYGQMDRNWGPAGITGIPLSDYAYNSVEAGFDVGVETVRLQSVARQLTDERDSLGLRVHRYFFAHRLTVRPSRRLSLALWETSVLAGEDREFDSRFRNPLSLLLLANQYGLGADGNIMLGLDGQWRASRALTLEGQLALDDLQYEKTGGGDRYPNRWAFTLAASGPLGSRLGWRAFYTQASSLAFRRLSPFESFTDAGVGLGRNFADMDQLSALATMPVGTRWLLTPELTVLRQGEGEINDPFPATPAEAGDIPQLFIGVVERTYRAAVGVSGRQGPLDLRASAGVHHVVNADHQEGRTVNRFEGRLQATLGVSRGGTLR
jgi:hypothetical protein